MYRIFSLLFILASCATLNNPRDVITGTDKEGNHYKMQIFKISRKSDSAVVTGSIRGIEYDQTGLAGATLVINKGQYSIANDQGHFYAKVAPGIYQLRTVSIGYAFLYLPSFELRRGDSLVVDCALSIKIEDLH